MLLRTPQGACRPICDVRGNVLVLLDENGHIAESCRYDGFGTPRLFDSSGSELPAPCSALGNPFGFACKRCDATTALCHFGVRWYDPDLRGTGMTCTPASAERSDLQTMGEVAVAPFVAPFVALYDQYLLSMEGKHYRAGQRGGEAAGAAFLLLAPWAQREARIPVVGRKLDSHRERRADKPQDAHQRQF